MASGPFSLLPDAVLGLTPRQFDFTQFAHDNLQEGDVTAATIDRDVQAILGALDEPADPAPGFDYLGLLDSLGVVNFDDEHATLPVMQDNLDQGDLLLQDAVDTTPVESFLPQPPPFDPNADPTVNLNFGLGARVPDDQNPPSNVGEGRQFNQVVTAPGYDLTLVNLTSLAATSFTVGDVFLLTITGPPFQAISVESWHSGVHMATAPFGQFGEDGKFTVRGVMQVESVGAWMETWYGGSTVIQITSFFVVPTP